MYVRCVITSFVAIRSGVSYWLLFMAILILKLVIKIIAAYMHIISDIVLLPFHPPD